MLFPKSCLRKLGTAVALLNLAVASPCLADAMPELPHGTAVYSAARPAAQSPWLIVPVPVFAAKAPRLPSAESGGWIAERAPSAESGSFLSGPRLPSAESGAMIDHP